MGLAILIMKVAQNIMTTKYAKIATITVVALLVAAALALTTVVVLRQVTPKKQSASTSPASQASDAMQKGIRAESSGNSAEALKSYQDSYEKYKQAGDEHGMADMAAKIQFMTNAMKQEALHANDSKDITAQDSDVGTP